MAINNNFTNHIHFSVHFGNPATLVNNDNILANTEAEQTAIQLTSPIGQSKPPANPMVMIIAKESILHNVCQIVEIYRRRRKKK